MEITLYLVWLTFETEKSPMQDNMRVKIFRNMDEMNNWVEEEARMIKQEEGEDVTIYWDYKEA